MIVGFLVAGLIFPQVVVLVWFDLGLHCVVHRFESWGNDDEGMAEVCGGGDGGRRKAFQI